MHWPWVQQTGAWLHPGQLLSPRLCEYTNFPGKTLAGGMGNSAKAGMAETSTSAANINTRSGPKHKRCRGHAHSHLAQGPARTLPAPAATGREASLRWSWLQLRVIQVIMIMIVAPKFELGSCSWRDIPGKAGAGAKLGNVGAGCPGPYPG